MGRLGWWSMLVVLVVACDGSVGSEAVGGGSAPLLTATEHLVSDDGVVGDEMGWAVDVEGDTLVAGVRGADANGTDSGAAYVFVRGSSGWTQQQKLTPSDAAAGQRFGTDVALSGDWILVGAPYRDGIHAQTGAAYLFQRSGGTWTQMTRLEAATPRLNAQLGTAVDLEGDTAVVGAPQDPVSGSGSGTVWVFVDDGSGTWTQQAELRAAGADAGDKLGISLSLDGDDLLAGASEDEARTYDISSGTAYVFVRSGTSWSQQARLRAPTSENYAQFGNAVALSGDTALVGAWLEDSAGSNAGAAYVFERSGTTWSEVQRLVGTGITGADRFGTSVALEGGTAVIGAPGYDEGSLGWVGTGFVYLRGSSWFEWDRITGDTAGDNDQIGKGVALRGDRVVLGAPGDPAGGTDDYVGALWVHDLIRLADGEGCSWGPECASGHCVDGVCCDTACGGGASNDCMACSTAEGAASDGTCGALTSGAAGAVTCRPAAGACDLAETCVAGDTACPADAVEPADTVCRPSVGDCDVEETCDGSGAACPADVVVASGTTCRASAGDCDVEETCDGSAGTCPADAVEPSTTVCRASTGPCDAAESCDGSTAACPADAAEPDGTSCADGTTCNGDEVCESGSCVAGTDLDCDDADPCTADMCAEPGGCAHEAIDGCCADDAACDDGDACTTDVCDPDAHTCSHEDVTGCTPDAGTADAGDGGAADAGTGDTDAGAIGSDAGAADAGAHADAGGTAPPRDRGGCGCRVAGSPAPWPTGFGWAALLSVPLIGLRLARRRRR